MRAQKHTIVGLAEVFIVMSLKDSLLVPIHAALQVYCFVPGSPYNSLGPPEKARKKNFDFFLLA